jgi:hypothetical protein
MDALARYAVKQRLTSLLKEAQAYQSPAQKLTAAPAQQVPAVTKGVVSAGTPAPSLVPPPMGKGAPAAMTPPIPKAPY